MDFITADALNMLHFCSIVSDDDDSDEDTKPVEEQESIYMNIQNLQKSTSEVTKDNILTYVKEKKMEDSTFTEEFLVSLFV